MKGDPIDALLTASAPSMIADLVKAAVTAAKLPPIAVIQRMREEKPSTGVRKLVIQFEQGLRATSSGNRCHLVARA